MASAYADAQQSRIARVAGILRKFLWRGGSQNGDIVVGQMLRC